jgi:DNA-binding MarR family transcriptional regulator
MTAPVGPATDDELAAELRLPLIRLARLLRAQRADHTVTLTQLSAMGSLGTYGPMSAGELANHERVQPPSMTKVIASLEERGLVKREQHPQDRRQAIIAITEEGLQLLDGERRLRDAWFAQRMVGLTPQERELLSKVVPILNRLVGPQP